MENFIYLCGDIHYSTVLYTTQASIVSILGMYSEPCQTSKMEHIAKTVDGF